MREYIMRNKHQNQLIKSHFKNRHRRPHNRKKRRSNNSRQYVSMDAYLNQNDICQLYDIIPQTSDSFNDTNSQIKIWKCSRCTYINTDITACSICHSPCPYSHQKSISTASFDIASYINNSTKENNKFLQQNTKKINNKRKKFKKDNRSFKLFDDNFKKYKQFMQKRKTSIIAHKTAPNDNYNVSVKKKIKESLVNVQVTIPSLLRQFSWKKMDTPSESVAKKVVNSTDRQQATKNDASLCYGEILETGVTKVLNNLNANHKKTKHFYDLGMGSGKVVVQAYLQCDNLRKCVGIELTQSRYLLAEALLQQLLDKGYLDRKFVCAEYKKGEFFKIIELNQIEEKNNWRMGDYCAAYNPSLRNDKNKVKNYNGIIIGINKNKTKYSILYDDGVKCHNIKHKYLFDLDKQRVLEIWNGSCFDYPNGIVDADIVIMAIRFLTKMQKASVDIMYTAPVGCRFLTYQYINSFEGFDEKRLCEINGGERYETSWCSSQRFYSWKLMK